MLEPSGTACWHTLNSSGASVPVHRCGREFFRKLSSGHMSDVEEEQPQLPSDEADSNAKSAAAAPPPKPHDIKLVLQGRSLCNVLVVIRRKLQLCIAQQGALSVQDVAHNAMLLDDIWMRWGRDPQFGGFATCLKAVDPDAQRTCSELFDECKELLAAVCETMPDLPESIAMVLNALTLARES